MALLKKFPSVFIHPFAPAGLFLLLCSVPRIYMFAVISTVLLHEAGHLTASLLFQKYPISFTIMPTGLSIQLPPSFSYAEEMAVAGAGPLMNLFYYGIASFFPFEVAQNVKTVALLLFIVNLLPIATFDGGRVLHSFLSFFFGTSFAERCLQITTAITLVILWIFSLYILFYSGINITLLLFCSYLFSFFMLKKQ